MAPEHYFTADLHLWHPNMLRRCARPFETDEAARNKMRDNINAVVGVNDRLSILGDLAVKTTWRKVAEWLDSLNCRNLDLSWGNHDDGVVAKLVKNQPGRFQRVDHVLRYQFGEQKVFCFHYACRTWRDSSHGSFHLHGHSHGNLPMLNRSMDVGVDTNNYKPYSYTEINARLSVIPYPGMSDPQHERQ